RHVADVNVIVVKRDAEDSCCAGRKNCSFLSAAGMVWIAKDDDLGCSVFRQEDISIRGHREQQSTLEISREYIDLKARGNSGREARRSLHCVGSICGPFADKRRSQIRLLA